MLHKKSHVVPHFITYPANKIILHQYQYLGMFPTTSVFKSGRLYSIQLFFAQRSENPDYPYAVFFLLNCRSHQSTFRSAFDTGQVCAVIFHDMVTSV